MNEAQKARKELLCSGYAFDDEIAEKMAVAVDKVQELELQIDEMKKNKCPNAADRDLAGICTVGPMYCQGCVESAKRVSDGMIASRDRKLEETLRLNGEYKRALELQLCQDGHVTECASRNDDGCSIACEAVRKVLGKHLKRKDSPRFFCNKCGFSGSEADLCEGRIGDRRHKRMGASGLCGYSAVELQS